MKNNINILVLFGLMFMSFGLCCLAIFTQDLLEDSRFNVPFRWRAPQVFFLGTGAMAVMTGLGLMLRQQWSTRTATLIMILAAGAWTLFAFKEMQKVDELIVLLGFTIFGYSALLFCILFLNNEYILRHFDHHPPPEEKNEDILDW